MCTRLLWFFIVASVVLASTTVILAAEQFPGTWNLNVAKSKYSPGPSPKSAIIHIEARDGGIRYTSDGVDAQGNPTHTEYSAKFDGKDFPLKGNRDADRISVKRIDEYTYEAVTKKGGKAALTTRNVVSQDGKTRTSTQTGKNAQGQDVNNIVVYEKQ